MTNLAASVRSFLDQPDAVIFVGSGLSQWSGLPSWEILLRDLVSLASRRGISTKLAEDALANRQLLEAADALQLTSSEVANAMRGPLGYSAAKPHEVHSLLVKLGPQRFVTTNYDSLIEQQLGLEGKLGPFRTVTSRQVSELADIIKASADHFIFKPHGDLSDSESLVLSSTQYERLVAGETNQIRRSLEILLVTRPVLFLGYGLRDPDTLLILRTLYDRYLGSIGHFMAVVADAGDEYRNYWWDRYRIRIIPYPTSLASNGLRDHSAFLDLLQGLVLPKTNRPKGIEHAKFALLMRLKYGSRHGIYLKVPGVTQRRISSIVEKMPLAKKSTHWGLSLMRECARHDFGWCAAIKKLSREYPSPSVRRVMKVISPYASLRAKDRFVIRAIRKPQGISALERLTFKELADDPVTIPEREALSALSSNGVSALELMEDFFRSYSGGKVEVTDNRVDAWIDLIRGCVQAGAEEFSTSVAAEYLASALPRQCKRHLLRRANDVRDPACDFVLGSIIIRLSVTTDDLRPQRARRLIDLYLDDELEIFPSPGEISTEKFISMVVLPLAERIGDDARRRQLMEQILSDAGEHHDRRYLPPWRRE